MNESQIVRKAIQRVKVDLHLQAALECSIRDHVRHVRFHIAAGKCVHHFPRKRLQFVRHPVAKIEPGQLVTPRSILETLNRAAIHLLNLTGPLVGAKEIRKAVVQTGIVGIPVDFSPVDRKRV